MAEAGERRPTLADRASPGAPGRAGSGAPGGRPGSARRPRPRWWFLAAALAVALLAALLWAVVKGILEMPGGLAAAIVFGWAMGTLTWRAGRPAWLAALVAGAAWLLGLALTWLLAMAILPDSTRSFGERLEATPFLDWLAPQFGLLEVAALVLYLSAALYGARSRAGHGRPGT